MCRQHFTWERDGIVILTQDERFWSRINKDGPVHPTTGTACWEHDAPSPTTGYGRFTLNGKRMDAHRASWMMHFGEIGSLWVLHKCDNRACVRPDHLFLGTQIENMMDMITKGRGARGERSGLSVLCDANVIDIRRRKATGESAKKIGEMYAITAAHVQQICRRLRWAHVP